VRERRQKEESELLQVRLQTGTLVPQTGFAMKRERERERESEDCDDGRQKKAR
jgi:hypothetical protein